MEVKVGDKVLAIISRSGSEFKILTKIERISGDEVLVRVKSDEFGEFNWWISPDPYIVDYAGFGKILCKNPNIFETENPDLYRCY